MIKIDDTYSARGDFPAIEGPVWLRQYDPLPTLPSRQFPAGTMVRNVSGSLVKVTEDGTDWEQAGYALIQDGNDVDLTQRNILKFGSAFTVADDEDGLRTIVDISASALLPDQTGNASKFLTTDGTAASWETVSTIPVTQVADTTARDALASAENVGKLFQTLDTNVIWLLESYAAPVIPLSEDFESYTIDAPPPSPWYTTGSTGTGVTLVKGGVDIETVNSGPAEPAWGAHGVTSPHGGSKQLFIGKLVTTSMDDFNGRQYAKRDVDLTAITSGTPITLTFWAKQFGADGITYDGFDLDIINNTTPGTTQVVHQDPFTSGHAYQLYTIDLKAYAGCNITLAFSAFADTSYPSCLFLDDINISAGGVSWRPIIPDQTGNSGKFLTTDGAGVSWGAISSTLQTAYEGGNIVTLSSSVGSFIIRDSASGTSSALFAVQPYSGFTDYFRVDANIFYMNNPVQVNVPGISDPAIYPGTSGKGEIGSATRVWYDGYFSHLHVSTIDVGNVFSPTDLSIGGPATSSVNFLSNQTASSAAAFKFSTSTDYVGGAFPVFQLNNLTSHKWFSLTPLTSTTFDMHFYRTTDSADLGGIVFGNGTANVNSILMSVGGSIDAASASALTIGGTNATSVVVTPPLVAQNYIEIDSISHPGFPAAGKVYIHGYTNNGFDQLMSHTSDEEHIVFNSDNTVIVRNTSGVALTKGDVVYVTGSTGNVPTVAKAKADVAATSSPYGFVFSDTIASPGFGRVMRLGVISGINTSGFTSGDRIYLSATTAGAYQNTDPGWPNYSAHLGVILNSGVGNGSIGVFCTNGFTGNESGTTNSSWSVGSSGTGSLAAASLDRSNAGALTIGGTNATSIQLGGTAAPNLFLNTSGTNRFVVQDTRLVPYQDITYAAGASDLRFSTVCTANLSVVEDVVADAAVDQYACLKVSTSTAGRYIMMAAGDDAGLFIGVSTALASGAGQLLKATFITGTVTTMLSDGTGTIPIGSGVVPSATVAGRVMAGSGGSVIGYNTGALVAATLDLPVSVR